MKTITLHDGRKAHFPDSAKPEVVAHTLAKLLSVQSPAKTTPFDPLIEKSKAETQQIKDGPKERMDREIRQDKLRSESEKRQELAHQGRHKQTMDVLTAHAKATTTVANGVNKGLDSIIKVLNRNAVTMEKSIEQLAMALQVLAKKSNDMDKLTESVGQLQEQLRESTDSLVKTMKSPRKIVHSTKGRPIGMQIGED